MKIDMSLVNGFFTSPAVVVGVLLAVIAGNVASHYYDNSRITSLDGEIVAVYPEYFVVKERQSDLACAITYQGVYPLYVKEWVYVEYSNLGPKADFCRGQLIKFKEVE